MKWVFKVTEGKGLQKTTDRLLGDFVSWAVATANV